MMTENGKRRPTHSSSQSLETELYNKAYKAALDLLDQGKAPASMITQILRMGSSKAELEMRKLQLDSQLSHAKIDSLNKGNEGEQRARDAMTAFSIYSGHVKE